MYKKNLPILVFYFSTLVAGIKVPTSDLVLKDRLWFYKESNIPFTGVAFVISKEFGTIIQQANYIDGLAWGKYYEWWPNGSKKVDGTYRFGMMYGRWKFFYENEKILCAGSFMNGKGHSSVDLITSIPQEGISGLWTFWDIDGRKIEEGYYNKNGTEKGNWAFWDFEGKKRVGKKIDYETFSNIGAYKHLDGMFLVTAPIDSESKAYTQAHGAIRNGKLDGPWTYWDGQGLISAKRHYDQGILWGQLTKYHSLGHKLADGVVKGLDDYGNLIKDGKWLFWNNQGILNEEVHYKDGKREGLTTCFSLTGNESAKIIYKNDKPWIGEWIIWYPNGLKKESGIYENGEKQSPWTTWFENGQKKSVIHYKESIKHGLYTEWNKDGRLTKDIEYDMGNPISEYIVEYKGESYTEINRRNGELSGSYIKWYTNGKKCEEGVYKYGRKGGVWTSWHENGEKSLHGKYSDGEPDGIHTKFDLEGRLTQTVEYVEGTIIAEYHINRNEKGFTEFHKKNGVLEGRWTQWYANGNLAEEGIYNNGKKSGTWKGWFSSSKQNYSCNYKEGKRYGTYKEWNSSGKKIKEIDYSNGSRIREYLLVKDGNGFMEINKVYGKLDGSWMRWYKEGKKEEEGKYRDGIKVGTWSRFSYNGSIIEEWNYDNRGRNLYEITYYDNGTVKQYRDYFSKTIQEYNVDGSLKGEKIPFN